MEAAVRQNALQRCIRQHGPLLYFNGWWRTGVHPNCKLNLHTASWFDFQQGIGGGTRHFAETAFGVGLKEFMERWGRLDQTQPLIPPPPLPPARGDVAETWERLIEQPRARAADWIERVRGVPAERVDSGFAYVDDAVVALFPPDLHGWLHRHVAKNGPSVAMPLRDPSGDVINIHLRPIHGTERRFVPKALLSSTHGPACYGLPTAALGANLTVVTEGAVDTMFAEAAVRDHLDSCAVGAASSSTLPAWAQWLARKARGMVVVVPHLDPPKQVNGRDVGEAGQRSSAKLVALLERCDISCRMFAWGAFHEALHDDSPRDLGDAVKAHGFDRSAAALLAGCAA